LSLPDLHAPITRKNSKDILPITGRKDPLVMKRRFIKNNLFDNVRDSCLVY